ncbi:MAG TPA: hypothetical protein VNB49_10545 [Candidatus Dormibacteraeota bacterium]|nr:hypothetical protein [Candidatus Dormibacteraeota bacterium]
MLGYETTVVNGQMVNVAPKAGFDPIIFGQAYTGPAMWPRQGVYNVPPIMPAGSLQSSMAPAAFGGSSYATPTMSSESGNVFHPTKSPLVFGLLFLIAGILMLQHIHYK